MYYEYTKNRLVLHIVLTAFDKIPLPLTQMPKRNVFVLLFFTGVALIAYRNCFDIFIPSDNYSLFYLFEKEGIRGAVQSFGPYFSLFPLIFFSI
jgi:hypothetical protein